MTRVLCFVNDKPFATAFGFSSALNLFNHVVPRGILFRMRVVKRDAVVDMKRWNRDRDGQKTGFGLELLNLWR